MADAPKDVIMLVEDDEGMRTAVSQWLKIAGFDVTAFASPGRALSTLDRHFPGVLVSDVRMPEMDGLELLRQVRDPEIPIVLMSAYRDVPLVVEAMRRGAYDFLEKPFDPERLVDVVRRACEKRRLTLENRFLHSQLEGNGIESRILGNSDAIKHLRRQILDVASTQVNVVVYGETGAGKELVARCIHDFSPRRAARYVVLNCGAIPDTLFESELFGSEAGAFTGSQKTRVGKMEFAHRGTLFLDEIESMPLASQVKVLRTLQEKSIERLGSNDSIPADFRTVAAAKVDLQDNNMFRSDLYYRLAVAEIRIPPLRERVEDIPLLFEYFAAEAAKTYGRELKRPDEDLHQTLTEAPWPGNVRELRNAAERYALGLDAMNYDKPSVIRRSLAEQMEQLETRIIERALERANGNVAIAMEELDVPRRTLNEKMQKYRINRNRFVNDAG